MVIGSVIAPIFFNTLEDSGSLPITCDVAQLTTGRRIIIHTQTGQITDAASGEQLAAFTLKPNNVSDEVRAGGRVPLIIGRTLTNNVREAKGLGESPLFLKPAVPEGKKGGWTLAQKMLGRACGVAGDRPRHELQPKVTTAGSQDTTGPMTRDEMIELACLGSRPIW